MASREELDLAFNVELNTRKLVTQMAAFDRSIQRTSMDLGNLSKKASAFGRSYEANFKSAEEAMDQFRKTVIKNESRIRNARLDEEKASTEDERKAAAERLSIAEKAASQAIRLARETAQESIKLARESAKEAQKVLIQSMDFGALTQEFSKAAAKTDWTEFRDNLQNELKEGLEEGFDSFKGKDLSGIIKGSGKFGSALLKGLGAGGGAALVRGGAKLQERGADMGGKGGAALKLVGSAMGRLGPVLGTVAKLGPLVASAASIFAALVKTVLDVEAAAKGMNKEILESAGAADILYEHGGDAQGAFKELDKTFDRIRADATNIAENIKFGMKAEDIINVTKGFNQAGVSLSSLNKSFSNAGNAAEVAGAQIQGFGDLARMSFIYSRIMGVGLSEITELQGEMFTELGMSLSGIRLQFATMTKDATEGGIATNKFFNIIRGISADLALYTTRMGQATTMLKLLGKVMNPREAQKFMQTAVQGLKQMGEEDRIRLTLLAGEGKMREVITKDLNRKTKLAYADLASASGQTLEKVSRAAAAGGDEIEEILAKVPKEQAAAFRSAMAEMKMDKNAMQKGGLVGVSEAASNLSAAGSLTATKAALQRFGGNKKLSEMTGLQALAARKASGTSLEQFRSMAKMEQAVDEQKEVMRKAFEAQKSGSVNEEQTKILARLEAIDITSADQLKAADDADIIAAMDRTSQEAIAAAAEQKDYAAETAKATSTVADKLEVVIEGIFEYLFVALKDVLSDLNEFINLVAAYTRTARPEKETRDRLRAGRTASNGKLIDALQRAAAGDAPGNLGDKLRTVIEPAFAKGMSQSAEESKKAFETASVEAAKKAKGAGLTKEEMEAAVKNGQEAYSKASAEQQMGGKAQNDLSEIAAIASKDLLQKSAQFSEIDTDKKAKFQAALGQGRSLSGAANEAGLSAKDMQGLMEETLKRMSPEDLARLAPKLQTVEAGFGGIKNRPQLPPGTPVAGGGSSAAAVPSAAGVGGSSASPGVAVAAPPPTKGEQAIVEQMGEGNIDVVSSLKDLWSLMSQKGIKLNQSWMDTKYKDVIEKGALEAIRKGLTEYAVYTAEDPQKILDRMKASGFTEVQDLAKKYEDDRARRLAGNAQGGLVTSIGGGLARVEAAPGEGLASIGPGERILPRGGGGGGNVVVNVNGIGGADLGNYLRAKVADAIYEYKRKEKFT